MDTQFLHTNRTNWYGGSVNYPLNRQKPKSSSYSAPLSLANSRVLSISVADRTGLGRTRICCQKSHNEREISATSDGAVTSVNGRSGSLESSVVMKSNSFLTTNVSTKLSDHKPNSTTLSPNGKEIEGSRQIQNAEDILEITSLVRSANLTITRERDPPKLPGIEGPSQLKSSSKGLGIVDFLHGKNFLITGATGFLAKVLIEKILRMQPDVGKLFLVIKAKDYESALQRLKNEVIYSELFRPLHETHGHEYEEFVLKRLIPVVGDITQDNLGIQTDVANELMKEVDLIVNSAANTTFDERYDVALDINTRGTSRLMKFGRLCERLQLFLQISTAYVNGQREGRVLEKPFHMGESIANEKAESPPPLDIQAEFDIANKTLKDIQAEISNPVKTNNHKAVDAEKQLAQSMKDLGMERARRYGWQDTYVFTKAMGEMLIDNGRGDLPVAIVRPSVIESTYSDPFPGWMEGNRMMDPIVLYYGKGQLTGFLADSNGVLDVVPADMVVNATLAAMAKHAGKFGLEVYHVASSVVNPLAFGDLAEVVFEHFKSNPYVDTKGKPIEIRKLKLFDTMDEFSSHIWSTAFNMPFNEGGGLSSSSARKMSERLKSISLKSIEQAKYLANIYKPYTFYQGRFDNSNTERLFQELSEEEKKSFGFDVGNIEWKYYISNTHIPGLRQHVMKGRGMKMV